MLQKVFVLIALIIVCSSCQFTETMVLNEDGSGNIAVELNMDEFMAMGGAAMDTVAKKIDTVISIKKLMEEKKDSISKLSKKERDDLKKMENFSIRINMDPEKSKMNYNLTSDFKSISEANELVNGLSKASGFVPSMDIGGMKSTNPKDDSGTDFMGVQFSFEKGVFKRDAFIKDEKLHQQQIDSLKGSEAFMSGVNYTLKYTFPRAIKTSSSEDATYSLDKKTITLQKNIIEYFKNPDLLDLEVKLEDN